MKSSGQDIESGTIPSKITHPRPVLNLLSLLEDARRAFLSLHFPRFYVRVTQYLLFILSISSVLFIFPFVRNSFSSPSPCAPSSRLRPLAKTPRSPRLFYFVYFE